MRFSLARALAVPAVAVGVASGIAVAAPVAHAQTDTGGTVAITLPLSYIAQLAKAGVVEFPVPLSELSVSTQDKTATVTFAVTGGDADVSVFVGSLDLSGSVDIADANGHLLTLGGLQLDVGTSSIVATPAGGGTPVTLLDLGGDVTFGLNSPQTYTASEMLVDPTGAAYLNSALHTSAFQAGQDVGSLSASWTLSE
jgi:hypothetical protein